MEKNQHLNGNYCGKSILKQKFYNVYDLKKFDNVLDFEIKLLERVRLMSEKITCQFLNETFEKCNLLNHKTSSSLMLKTNLLPPHVFFTAVFSILP